MSPRLNIFANRIARGVRQLRRDRRGATLVEFSLIAFPSLILLLGTFGSIASGVILFALLALATGSVPIAALIDLVGGV